MTHSFTEITSTRQTFSNTTTEKGVVLQVPAVVRWTGLLQGKDLGPEEGRASDQNVGKIANSQSWYLENHPFSCLNLRRPSCNTTTGHQ